MARHEQVARRLLAEAAIAAGDPHRGIELLVRSYDEQFAADSRRLTSRFNWIRLNADLNARVAELFEIGSAETQQFLRE